MANKKGGKGSKEKTEKKKKPSAKVAAVYEVAGDSLKRKNRKCPKCDVFLGQHQNRVHCGKCGYTEMK
ncbi:30S ribosomal protein S27ae [Candidatus Woesearchaeota archaeon]|nr:30S ribosomal protein S27ae [Candidatus Woesearchaeota archaeon]